MQRKKLNFLSIILAVIVTFTLNANCEEQKKIISSHTFGILPSPPKLAVDSYIMLDAQTDTVLASYNEDKKIHPASLTKLMTAYLIDKSIADGTLNKEDKVNISQNAWKMTGSTMFLEAGQKVSVAQLLKGIIIVSGNDASTAMAEHIAGSEEGFAEMMNKMALHLGMKNSSFVNSSGMPDNNHYSTASDLAMLSKHVIMDYPEDFKLYSEKYFQYGIDRKTKQPLQEQKNRNRLLWVSPYVDGLKTGHIQDSGYHLAITGMQHDRRIIIILLGAKSELQRSDDAQKLFTYGFNFFTNAKISSANETLKEIKVWGGTKNFLNIGVTDDILVTIPKGMTDKLTVTIDADKHLEAPIKKDKVIGSITVKLNNKVIKVKKLVALESVSQGGWFKRTLDKCKRLFLNFFE